MRKILQAAFAVFISATTLNGQGFYNPVAIPPVLTGTNFTLTVDEDSMEFWPGIKTATYGVNGPILGPTLVVNKGDNVSITVENHLEEMTTMHWHGLHVPGMYDGGPHQEIDTGTTWTASFEIKNKAAMYWYHPHPHGGTTSQVMKGIGGLIMVKDAEESALILPREYGVDDFPVVIQDKSFNGTGQFVNDVLSDSMMVNGTLHAVMNCPAQIVRLRLLNGSVARCYNIGFSDNRDFYVIASDGSMLQLPHQTNRLLLTNGERYEILVDLTGMQGDSLILMSYGATMGATVPGGGTTMSGNSPLNAADFGIMMITVGAPTPNPVPGLPFSLLPLDTLFEADADRTRIKELAGMGGPLMGMFTINNLNFDMMVINDTVRLGDTEIWEYINTTGVGHPMHMHDVQFRILDRNSSPPEPYETGWKDVFFVDAGDTVRVITQFLDYFSAADPYMYHCHNLRHEDDGMMLQFIVVDSLVSVDRPAVKGWNLYPNPAEKEFVISKAGENRPVESVSIMDFSGKVIFTRDCSFLNAQKITIPVDGIAKGIYLVRVTSGDETWQTKIMIR